MGTYINIVVHIIFCVCVVCVGLARTIYIRCIYGNYGREITKYMLIYGVDTHLWPTLRACICTQCALLLATLKALTLTHKSRSIVTTQCTLLLETLKALTLTHISRSIVTTHTLCFPELTHTTHTHTTHTQHIHTSTHTHICQCPSAPCAAFPPAPAPHVLCPQALPAPSLPGGCAWSGECLPLWHAPWGGSVQGKMDCWSGFGTTQLIISKLDAIAEASAFLFGTHHGGALCNKKRIVGVDLERRN